MMEMVTVVNLMKLFMINVGMLEELPLLGMMHSVTLMCISYAKPTQLEWKVDINVTNIGVIYQFQYILTDKVQIIVILSVH